MGLFDFFKRRETKSLGLEEIMEKAVNDTAYRPLFYRELMKSDLFILANKSDKIQIGSHISKVDQTINVRTLNNDSIPVFTSPSKISESEIAVEGVYYVKMKADVIFKLFNEGTTFLLNPFCTVCKEFDPDEIKKLLTNKFFKIDEIKTIRPGTRISFGIPEHYPVNLVQAVKRYIDSKPEIKSAYLANMDNKSSADPPHLVLGLNCSRSMTKPIVEEVIQLCRPYLNKGEFIDIVNLSDRGKPFKAMQNNKFKIY